MIKLVKILKDANKSFKTNKTFTSKNLNIENSSIHINISFNGSNLFIRIEAFNYNNEIMNDKFANIIINMETLAYETNGATPFEMEEVLKQVSKMRYLITAKYNPSNILQKAAKKLKIKNYKIDASDRSASAYLIDADKRTILRVADHSINTNLVFKMGYTMPKFNIMFENDGSNVSFYQNYKPLGCESIRFTPNFI